MKWAIHEARSEDLPLLRALFEEYRQWLGESLFFQGFQEELDGLPGAYARPSGALYLGTLDHEPAGCVGVRPLDHRLCEMKRLFVRENARGMGLGLGLARRALRDGRKMGYAAMRLDTLGHMDKAIRLYEDLGFYRIEAYYENPLPDVVFMERRLV